LLYEASSSEASSERKSPPVDHDFGPLRLASPGDTGRAEQGIERERTKRNEIDFIKVKGGCEAAFSVSSDLFQPFSWDL
jgi:hypothetical protein